MKKVIIGIVLLASVLSSCRQPNAPFDTERLDEYFEAISPRYMGSVAISINGETVYTHCSGMSDIDAGTPITGHSRFMIGSISKTFTSVMTFMAIDEGLLSLDDNLAKFYPEAGIMNADKITINDLLYHKSGIHDIFEGTGDYLEWYTSPQTRDRLIHRIADAGADTIPGAVQQYCNSGYVLLSFILEDVIGCSYAELLNNKITGLLGLAETSLSDGIEPEKGECRSYVYNNGWQPDAETDPSVPMGAGAIMSNPADLIRFGNALFNDQLGDSILSRMSRIDGSLGRGLFPFTFYEKNGLGHTGGIDGFQSALCHFNDGDITIAICSNGINFNQNDILIAILDAIHGKEYEIPNLKYISVDSAILESYTGDYFNETLNLGISITTDGKSLTAQATRQSAFSLDATSDSVFECTRAGVVISFKDGNLILNQSGQTFTFVKQE